jgi:hypothetical protein
LRARSPFYGALAATWLVLAACLVLGPSNETVGFATKSPVSAWQWLMTQAPVVVQYVRLSLWPCPQRTAYDWPVARELTLGIAMHGLTVLALLGATIAAWRTGRPAAVAWGFLGASFFLLLAPTSTVLPIVTEIAAERRAYLPMLLVIVPAVFVGGRLATAIARRRRLPAGQAAGVLLALTVLALALVARQRVEVYADKGAFWRDAYDERDPDRRSFVAGLIHVNHGIRLLDEGHVDEGSACMDFAMTCEHPTPAWISLHARSLVKRGRHAEAVARMRRLVQTDPSGTTWGTLGVCLVAAHGADHGAANDPRLAEAEDVLRKALERKPDNHLYWLSFAYVLGATGRMTEAERAQKRAMAARER